MRPHFNQVVTSREKLTHSIYLLVMSEREHVEHESRHREEARDRAQKEHNDKAMLRITLASTFVAVVAAAAAMWTGYEAHLTRVEDERPYIRAEFMGVAPETVVSADGKSSERFLTPHVKLIGIGKTPAEDAMVELKCYTSPLAQSLELAYSYEQVFPEDQHVIYCQTNPQIHMADEKPDGGVMVSGSVSYNDVEGRKYKTVFCYYWTAQRDERPEHTEDCIS